MVSDTFLLQKQQTFNRSKTLESESVVRGRLATVG